MRSTSKILAAAALALLSVSSFAAQTDWTGSLAAVKIKYFPNNNGSGAGVLLLTGTGSPCRWVTTPGAMDLGAANSAEGDEVRNLFNFLTQAKAAGTTVTLTYDNATNLCDIVAYSR